MAERPGEEEIEVTGPEKLLAALLAVFIAVGAVWAYFEIDDLGAGSSQDSGYTVGPTWHEVRAGLDPADRSALREFKTAQRAERRIEKKVRNARSDMVVAREAYRTELDAGREAAAAEAAYRRANERLEAATAELMRANAAVASLRPDAAAAKRAEAEERRKLRDQAAQKTASHDRQTFILRLCLLVALLALGLILLRRGRRRLGRWQLVPAAVLAATAVLAVVMALDYGSDVFDYRDVGPGLVSAIGIVLTLVTLLLVQRGIARRLPYRRVRRGLCPFCGFPRGEGDHCEGCGRPTVSPCTTCDRPRRVGTRHCAHCGSA